jgi:hypothetical protein
LCESKRGKQDDSGEYKPTEQFHQVCDAINGRMTANTEVSGTDLLWMKTHPE